MPAEIQWIERLFRREVAALCPWYLGCLAIVMDTWDTGRAWRSIMANYAVIMR